MKHVSNITILVSIIVVAVMLALSPSAKTMITTTRYESSAVVTQQPEKEGPKRSIPLAMATSSSKPRVDNNLPRPGTISSAPTSTEMKPQNERNSETSHDFDDVDPADPNPTAQDLALSAAHDPAEILRREINVESGRMGASNRLCQTNASRITFVPPNFPRSKCRVWVYLPNVSEATYERPVCEALQYRPNDGDIYKNIHMMDGYYVDYALIEIYKVHPCRLYSLDNVTNYQNIIGFLPVATMNAPTWDVVRTLGAARLAAMPLTKRARLFMFMSSILSPNPYKKTIKKHLTDINFVIHEVAMWDKHSKMNARGGPFHQGYVMHPKKILNASVNCFRHALIPKVDWAVKTPLPVDTDKGERNNASSLLFLSARVQSYDRVLLWELAQKLHSPRNFTFQTGRNVRETFSSGIANSIFCVDTTGDSLTTFRITNAVVRGCIPVLICDDCVFPFAKLFNYRIANNYEEMVESLKAAPYRSRYPTFAIRISQFNVLWKDSSMIIDMLYRLYHEERALVNKLYAGLQRVQKYFLSPFEKGSRYADALLEDMNIGATRLNTTNGADFAMNKLCPY